MISSCCNLTENKKKLINSQNYISDITIFIVPQHIYNFAAISIKSLKAPCGLQKKMLHLFSV